MTEEAAARDRELLSAHLDGELDPPAAGQLRARLAASAALRRERDRLLEVSARLALRCEPDPGFVVRHRERRESASPIRRWSWRQLGLRLAAAAAVLLAAAVLGVWRTAAPGPPEGGAAADLLALEGELLAAPGAEPGLLAGLRAAGAPAFGRGSPAEAEPEPVLLIAFGASLPPPAER